MRVDVIVEYLGVGFEYLGRGVGVPRKEGIGRKGNNRESGEDYQNMYGMSTLGSLDARDLQRRIE